MVARVAARVAAPAEARSTTGAARSTPRKAAGRAAAAAAPAATLPVSPKNLRRLVLTSGFRVGATARAPRRNPLPVRAARPATSAPRSAVSIVDSTLSGDLNRNASDAMLPERPGIERTTGEPSAEGLRMNGESPSCQRCISSGDWPINMVPMPMPSGLGVGLPSGPRLK